MESTDPQHGSRRFWNELYWFVLLAITAWVIGALVLPPRILEVFELVRHEARAQADLDRAREREIVLHEAIEAMENDPFYRRGVLRRVLGVKRFSEEFLKPSGAPFPITRLGEDSGN